MAALLCNTSTVDNDYLISVTDSGKSVSDDKGGSVFHKSHHCGLNVHLSSGINRGSGFVKNKYLRVGKHCSCYGKQLTLSLRKVRAAFCEDGIIALRKSFYELVCVRKLCRRLYFIKGGVFSAVADILLYGVLKSTVSCKTMAMERLSLSFGIS